MPTWRRYLTAIALVGAATGLAALADPYVSAADLVMLYLLAIRVGGLLGRGPSLAAASLSVAAYDFFFVEPRLTFSVRDGGHVLTFAVMFAVGLVMAGA